MQRVALSCLVLILISASGHSQKKDTVSARQVLDRMVAVYGSCDSYMDQGQAKEVIFITGGSRVVIKRFTTAFVRPSQFRFEFSEDSDRASQRFELARDKTSIRSWWSIRPETRYYETLKEPIANATGISSMSAILVPSMLFQNLGDRQLIQSLTELTLVREEKVGGRTALRIQGTSVNKTPLTVWIDKETFLLLKLFQKRSTDNYDVELTIQYEPKINPDVPPDKLAFKH